MIPTESELLTEIQAALDDLERSGLVRRNGEMRPDRSGKLCPVYVKTEKMDPWESTLIH